MKNISQICWTVFSKYRLVFNLDRDRTSGAPYRMPWAGGSWNDPGATLGFNILPNWYQSLSFRVLCIALGIVVVWALYRLRIRQVTRAIGARFDARLAERMRIARELNDTLLQTVEGSKLVAAEALETNNPEQLRSAMEKLSGWLEQGTREGQAALNSLRSPGIDTNDLTTKLRRATEECANNQSMSVRFSVAGDIREMHAIVRDETFRIGYEAIRNACEHSLATELEVHLNYGQDLTLRVRDNGIGIDSSVATSGQSVHSSLSGMRERANRTGSELTVVSAPGSGTEITLVVPGRVIFRKANAVRWEKARTLFGLRIRRSDHD